jgi:hypothetical protein
LAEKQLSLHVPLCQLLFNEEGVPELNNAETHNNSVQTHIAEFITTDCVAREGYIPARNVYRIPIAASDAAAPTPQPGSTHEVEEAGDTNAEEEEVDENGWSIEKNDFFIRGSRLIIKLYCRLFSYHAIVLFTPA